MKKYFKFGQWVFDIDKISKLYKEEKDKIEIILDDEQKLIHSFEGEYERDLVFNLLCRKIKINSEEDDIDYEIRNILYRLNVDIMNFSKNIGKMSFKIQKLETEIKLMKKQHSPLPS